MTAEKSNWAERPARLLASLVARGRSEGRRIWRLLVRDGRRKNAPFGLWDTISMRHGKPDGLLFFR